MKHLGKIIDLIKADDEYNDSNGRMWQNVSHRYSLQNFIREHKRLTRQQYIELMSGKLSYGFQRMAKDLIQNIGKEHNNEQLNEIVFKNIEKKIEVLKGSEDPDPDMENDFVDLEDHKNAILQFGNISKKRLGSTIEDGNINILKNPNFEKEHLLKMIEKHPEHSNEYIEHKHIDDKMSEKLLTDVEYSDHIEFRQVNQIIARKMQGYNGNGEKIEDKDQSLDLNPRVIKHLIENNSSDLNQSAFNVLLDHAEPSFKKEFTNKMLGITGGQYTSNQPEDYTNDADFQHDNWANHGAGPEYSPKIVSMLLKSRHLDDEQAEHVKRHGDFEDKYALYHNKDIDPRHGAEMFQKWHDDDHHNGYDSDELVAQHKDDDEHFTHEDLDQDTQDAIIEQGDDNGDIDEWARESYSDNDYMNDHEDDLIENMGSDFDDLDEMNELLHSNYDWNSVNLSSEQNEGIPEFDNLNKVFDEHFKTDNYIYKEDLEKLGISDPSKIGLKFSEDGDIDMDDVKSELDKYGGPLNIDYADNEYDLNIDEHPDYDDRYNESADEHRRELLNGDKRWEISDALYLYEDMYESDQYQEARREAQQSYLEENSSDHVEELYDQSHQNIRFIPKHLHDSIPNIEEIKNNELQQSRDNGKGSFLNKHIKDRSYEHPYGENQHFFEMVKDHAEANNGKIDVGTMNKLYPAQKDKWKKIFNGKGKLTSEEANLKLEELPKSNYNISFGKWDSGKMQNFNGRDQVIVKLDHSEDTLKALKEDSDVYNTFQSVQNISQQSGHPTNNNTIAWARVDMTDPKHYFIDEVQSDFGKTVTRYLRDNGGEHKAEHIDKISAHHKNWREAIINSVIKEARNHGAEKVSTHSPESKSNHTHSSKVHSVYKDSYQKVPRQMGFKPSDHETLPLADRAKKHFEGKDVERAIKSHEDAIDHHNDESEGYIDIANNHQLSSFNLSFKNSSLDFSKKHSDLAEQHRKKLTEYGQESYIPSTFEKNNESGHDGRIDHMSENDNVKPHKADKSLNNPIVTENKKLQGHTFSIKPSLLKKSIVYAIDLIKKENELNNLNKWQKRFEKLEKGSFQRRNKFNPNSISSEGHKIIDEWQSDGDNREDISRLEGSGRNRALKKLASMTEVKTKEGKRHYLLHRGMSDMEHDENISRKNGTTNYHSSKYNKTNSWTPKYGIASGFAEQGIDESQSTEYSNKSYSESLPVSAWISEDDIHNYLPQGGGSDGEYGGKIKSGNEYKDEHEVVVNHTQPHHLAHPKIIEESARRNRPSITPNKSAVLAPRMNQINKLNPESAKVERNRRINARAVPGANKRTELKNEVKENKEIKEYGNISDSSKRNALNRRLLDSKVPKKLAASEVLVDDLNKGDITNAFRGAALATAMTVGVASMDQPTPDKLVTKETPKHARSGASLNSTNNYYEAAKKETGDMLYNNEKKFFLNKHSDGLSPHVYKQTIKNNNELSNKYGHVNKYSNSTFKEVVSKNNELRDDVHNAHFDKLHKEFGGDHEKILHAWKNGAKNTHEKFRDPASVKANTNIGEHKMEDSVGAPNINKGEITNAIKGIALGASLAANVGNTKVVDHDNNQTQVQPKSNISRSISDHDSKNHTLHAISMVESSGGTNTKHAKLPENSIHKGEKAFGSYGLTPLLIRETIKGHPDLNKNFGHLTKLKGDNFHKEMSKVNDGGKFEKDIASRHYDRVAKQFGHSPQKIGMAWLNGIAGTHKAIKNNVDIDNHWHVKKIMHHYNKSKNK